MEPKTESSPDPGPVQSFGPNPVKLGRVFDLSEVETYHCQAVLAFRDQFTPGIDFLASNPVPVLSSDGTRLGYAHIHQDTTRALAQIFLRRDCPERLDIENGRSLWPQAVFKLMPSGDIRVLRIAGFVAEDAVDLVDARLPPISTTIL